MASAEERRRYQRLLVTLPVEYSACPPAPGEPPQHYGILKNFSLSGAYLHALEPVTLQLGQILTLIISTPLAPWCRDDASLIQAQAAVVRLEKPSPDSDYHGIAVFFLDPPSFLSMTKRVNNNC